ncbi:hypothetical protein [Actinophytocola sp.]|uniref:hypothetical protein n=1 Tax=Actinophytocola sp. TaxID=1872138 RepID=UPI002ED4688A
MPANHRGLTRAARRRAKAMGISHQKAYEDVQAIRELMHVEDWTWDEAEAFYDDPGNELLCEKCGWTVAMVCPECPGCGCYNGRCSGWRHDVAFDDGEPEEDIICEECGADASFNPYAECQCA